MVRLRLALRRLCRGLGLRSRRRRLGGEIGAWLIIRPPMSIAWLGWGCRWQCGRWGLADGRRSAIIPARTMTRRIRLVCIRVSGCRRIGMAIPVVAWVPGSIRPIAGVAAIAVSSIVHPVVGRLVIAIPIRVLPWWPRPVGMGTMISAIPRAVAVVVARAMIRRDGNIEGVKAVAEVTDVAGIIGIRGISEGIEVDFPMGDALRPINGKFETAIEREFCANDLIGERRALHELIAAVDVSFGDEIGDDISATLLHLPGRQLVGFVHECEQRCRPAMGRPFVVLPRRGTARAQPGEYTKNKRQNHGGNFHERAGGTGDSDA